jgi:hypothetical protein
MNAAGGAPASQGGADSAQAGSGGASAAGTGNGGSLATGGASSASGSGRSSNGGASAQGGLSASGGGSQGANAGSGSAGSSTGGASGLDGVAKGLDGVRIDDPCAGTPATTEGATCNHVMLTNNQFKATKEVTLGGSAGTTYDVTLRIRGVVEPTNVSGGTRPDTSTVSYKNGMWRKTPYTIGGTVSQPDYQAFSITVASPQQQYFLNDYQKAAHLVFKLDYEVTIPMAGNTKVTLNCVDSNEREIDNFENYAIDGLAGSVNYGQFLQVNVVSVKAR